MALELANPAVPHARRAAGGTPAASSAPKATAGALGRRPSSCSRVNGRRITTPAAWLTIAAMAALGLDVDLKLIAQVGRPVIATVTGPLILFIVLRVALIHGLGIR